MTDTNKEREALRNLLWAAEERDKGNRIRQFDEFIDAARASLSAEAEPTDDVKQKIASNQWDHFGDLLPTLKAISRGDWYWGANSRCKYIEIRLDTRDGGCLLFDRERVRISPEQFAHQSYGGFKMDPWPAFSSLAAPAQAPAPGWQDIATAPRDGTPIWLYTASGQCEGYWNYGEWVQDAVYCTYDGAGGPAFECSPTHWMPLPAAPSSGKGG